MYAMIFTDDGPDVMFYHPDTQVFEELMPNEFHRFEYLYYDWENIDSPHGSPFVPGPNPVGMNDAFMCFDSDFTDRGQQLSPVKKSSSGRVNKKRVRFSEDLEAIRIIPNRHELAQMAAENEDKDEDEIWFSPRPRMNRRKVATRAKARAETETEEDDLWLW